MSTVDEAKLSWLKTLGVPDATITALSAKGGTGAPAEPVGGNADSVPDIINGDVARADTEQRDGTEVPPRNTDKEQQSKRDNWKPTSFPPGVPDKDEQDRRDNRNDSGAFKGKTVTVKDPRKPKNQPPKGKAQPLRLVLDSKGITAAGREPGKAVKIQGEILFESNANVKDVDAILKAIEKEAIKVSIGGVTAKVELRLVERNDKSDKRFAIKVFVLTSIPTIERPAKDDYGDAPVVVQIGDDIRSDGKATIKVQYKPSPSKDPKTPAPTGSEVLDLVKPF